MITVFKEIIQGFHSESIPASTPRRLNVQTVPEKVTVCVGMRRSGKSTYMYQRMEQLLASGVPFDSILHINFLDERLRGLKSQQLGDILMAYYELYPHAKESGKCYFFFDEIQVVEGWELFIERIRRTENVDIFITGSSAKMLSKEIATEMRGRSLSWEIFPFSFKEYLDYVGVKEKASYVPKDQGILKQHFDQYWKKGGFAEVFDVGSNVQIKIHQEYFSTVVLRDVIERYDLGHPKMVMDLAHYLMENIGSLYSINRLVGHMKSLGYVASKQSVGDCLDHFEDAFFLFSVRMFDASWTRSNRNPKKIYAVDHALVAAVASGVLQNRGHLLENLVFVALRRICPDIFYYKTQQSEEVDFIALMPNRSHWLVQVCESINDPATKKRELKALARAMQERGIREATLVTRSESDLVDLEAGRIRVVPVWRFLLELPDWIEV